MASSSAATEGGPREGVPPPNKDSVGRPCKDHANLTPNIYSTFLSNLAELRYSIVRGRRDGPSMLM